MASPQLENGSIAVAKDLQLAMDRADWTALERRVVSAVIYFTYGAERSKAELTAEDIRYYLGAPDNMRTARVEQVITKLISMKILFRQELVNGKQLLGLQKDYDLWLLKINGTLQGINSKETKSYVVVPLKINAPSELTTPQKLLEYAMAKGHFKYSIGTYRAELKQARRLYQDLLVSVESGPRAYELLTDFIDENEWMQLNVKMQFTYMTTWFPKWLAQVPKIKPREIREDEEATGKRHRYNVKLKRWVTT